MDGGKGGRRHFCTYIVTSVTIWYSVPFLSLLPDLLVEQFQELPSQRKYRGVLYTITRETCILCQITLLKIVLLKERLPNADVLSILPGSDGNS